MTSTRTQTAPELFALPALHAAIRQDAAGVAADFAERSREVRLHLLERGEIHPALWQEFSGRGWAGMLVPEAYGGTKGGLLGLVTVLEELAAANIVLWMPVLSASIGHALVQVGPERTRERWLRALASGEASLALAATEPDCGHNLFRVRTTIRRDGDEFVVNGVKAVTSGLDVAERVMVFGRAHHDGGATQRVFTTVLVDPAAPGVTATELPMRGREGVKQFRLELEDVRVPADDLVGAEGEGLMVVWPFTHVERLLTAALCLGNARYCVTRAVAKAKERTIFGKLPIGADQAVQHPLAGLHARLEATRLFVYRAAAGFDAGTDPGAVAGEANMAKVLTADLLYDAADHAMQTLGAEAWDEREGMLDVFLDARLSRSAPISQQLALNFIAEHALGLPSHR